MLSLIAPLEFGRIICRYPYIMCLGLGLIHLICLPWCMQICTMNGSPWFFIGGLLSNSCKWYNFQWHLGPNMQKLFMGKLVANIFDVASHSSKHGRIWLMVIMSGPIAHSIFLSLNLENKFVWSYRMNHNWKNMNLNSLAI